MAIVPPIAVLPLVGVAGLLLWAAVTDFVSYRIPNRLILGMLACYPCALVLEAVPVDPWAPVAALAVLLLGFGLFALGKVGGGDVKLLAAAALWVGPGDVASLLFLTGIYGGLLALAVTGWRRNTLIYASTALRCERLRDGLIAGQLPYGVAIAAAGLTVLLPHLAHLPVAG